MIPRLPAWLLLLSVSGPVSGAEHLDFYRDIYPFLQANCVSCHNETTTKAGLNMETPDRMRQGGDSGPGLLPGKGGESLVVLASLHRENLEMPPPNNKSGAVNLTETEIALLKAWIDQGARDSVRAERTVTWQPVPAGVQPIYAVAISADGRHAACGRSHRLHLYDLATRTLAAELTDHEGPAHRAPIQSVAFSPDGTRLATGSFREVKIWRRSDSLSPALPAKIPHASASRLFPDGNRLLSVTPEGDLHVTDLATGHRLGFVPGALPDSVRLLALSPDGTRVAILGNEGDLVVRSLPDGKVVAGHSGSRETSALAWTSDSGSLLTAGEDGMLRAWSLPADPALGLQPVAEVSVSTGPVGLLAPGPTPDQALSAGPDGVLRLWTLSGASLTREFSGPPVLSFALSRDGTNLATGHADGIVRVRNLATGESVAELTETRSRKRQVAELDWTVAAETLEQAHQKAVLARIEAQNKALEELLKKARDAIAAMTKVLPDKEKALAPAQEATATARTALDEILARSGPAPDATPDAALEKERKAAQDKLLSATLAEEAAVAAFTSTRKNITDAEAEVTRIAASKDRNATELEAANRSLETSRKRQEEATAALAAARQPVPAENAPNLAVAFSFDGRHVAATTRNGILHGWAIATGLPVAEEVSTTRSALDLLVARPDGSFVAGAGQGDAALLAAATAPAWLLERVLGGEADPARFADRVNAVAFSPDGRTLATGGGELSRSGDLHLFDVASGKLLRAWPGLHQDAVLSLSFRSDGLAIASGAADYLARVTPLDPEGESRIFDGHTHHVTGVSFRADGRVLASAGADGVVMTWDLLLGERKKKIVGWTKEVTSVQFLGATNRILTSSGDNLVRVVNDEGAEVRSIANLPDFMQAAAAAPSATPIVAGGEDSILRVWDGGSGTELVTFIP